MGPCVDGVLMPPMATGKRKRSYSRIPLVRASLCGPFPPRRLRRHRGSLSSHQSKTLKKISKMRKCLMDRNLRVLFQKRHQKENFDDEISGLDIRFPTKFSYLLVFFRC